MNTVTPRQSSKPRAPKAGPPKVARFIGSAPGALIAQSSSGTGWCRVALAPLGCDCPGFQHYQHCYHTDAVRNGQAGAYFTPLPSALRALWQRTAPTPCPVYCRCTCSPYGMEPGEQCALCGRYWAARS